MHKSFLYLHHHYKRKKARKVNACNDISMEMEYHQSAGKFKNLTKKLKKKRKEWMRKKKEKEKERK